MRERFYVDLPRHFIFNALNCIIALCRVDPEKGARLTAAFAQCINYTSGTAQKVLINEELEAIEAYLYVQSIRFMPRFKFSVAGNKENMQINRYAVFNIVESCVREAVEKYADDICIEVEIRKSENYIAVLKVNQKIEAECVISVIR